ncbi:MAG: hypothetical protein KME30_18045 [Iphinoe sp. HA4291-MV1]|jgi:hypothetical protein|nr:hypothetical protein [Iphinoe sp. HA4291-MV1]
MVRNQSSTARCSRVAQENLNTFWQTLQQKAEELQERRARASKKQRIEHRNLK